MLATEEHVHAVAAFYREVWDPEATAESVIAARRLDAERNVAAPGEPTPTALVLEGTRVIGYCGSIAQRLWDGREERPAYWVKGLMVLPEFRSGPVGYLVVKELARHLDCSTILTVAPAARRLFGALGYTDLGAVPNWVRPLRPHVMANRLDLATLGLGNLPGWVGAGVQAARRTGVATLAGRTAGLLLDAAVTAARLPAWSLDTTDTMPPTVAELDQLWLSARDSISASPVRDGTYLSRRFLHAPAESGDNPYTVVGARDGGGLVGAAALRRPRTTSDARLAGLRVATLSDIVFPLDRPDAGLATLGAIERQARAAGADALTCMTSHASLSVLLRRQGYLRLGGNVHFFLRDVTGAGPWPMDLGAWWLARGDGESDASF